MSTALPLSASEPRPASVALSRLAPHIIVIGAGVGGLAVAVRLLSQGYRVTVLERAATPGGKMRQVRVGGHVFDGGPSVMTMPAVLQRLCAAASVRQEDLIPLEPLEPLCRHFFPDGSQLDLFNDEPLAPGARHEAAWMRSADEIRRVIGPRAAEQYHRFRRHAARIYASVERPFMASALPRNPLAMMWMHPPRYMLGMFRIDARRTLWRALEAFFEDERLRVLLARYATYSGADPFLAPATLSVIPHVEFAFGVYAVKGGMYRVAEALTELIVRQGGQLRCAADVERVELDGPEQRVVAVHVAGERLAADAVVANCDVGHLYGSLLSGTRLGARWSQKIQKLPPSLSAQLNLVVAEAAAALPLCHHNVFFTQDYAREFRELTAGPPSDPTIYLCNPDFGQAQQRWFFLTNAPPLPGASTDPAVQHSSRWSTEQQEQCRERVALKLARHGIDFAQHARAEQTVTPRDLAALFPATQGAIYGAAASSRLAAFKRPPNQVPGVANLYCVGGSTHPGAGVPMVMLSAEIVAKLIGPAR